MVWLDRIPHACHQAEAAAEELVTQGSALLFHPARGVSFRQLWTGPCHVWSGRLMGEPASRRADTGEPEVLPAEQLAAARLAPWSHDGGPLP